MIAFSAVYITRVLLDSVLNIRATFFRLSISLRRL